MNDIANEDDDDDDEDEEPGRYVGVKSFKRRGTPRGVAPSVASDRCSGRARASCTTILSEKAPRSVSQHSLTPSPLEAGRHDAATSDRASASCGRN